MAHLIPQTSFSLDLFSDLQRAFGELPVPDQLLSEVSTALTEYASGASRQHKLMFLWQERWEAASKVERAAGALMEAIADADVAFGPVASEDWVNNYWSGLAAHTERVLAKLTPALAEGVPPLGKQGRPPHAPREVLRQSVFAAAEEAGIRVTQSRRGRVAQIWAAVAREADRIDGTRASGRSRFSGADWKRWVSVYNQFSSAFLELVDGAVNDSGEPDRGSRSKRKPSRQE